MTFAWSSRLLLVLSLLLCSSCVASYRIPDKEGHIDEKVTEDESSNLTAEISVSRATKDQETDKENNESSSSPPPKVPEGESSALLAEISASQTAKNQETEKENRYENTKNSH